MPSRIRLVFIDPIDTLQAGRKVAHMGHKAYERLENYVRAIHKGLPSHYLVPPPGTLQQRATWLWNQIPVAQKLNAGLYLVRERRSLKWHRSNANPNNLGVLRATLLQLKSKPPSEGPGIFTTYLDEYKTTAAAVQAAAKTAFKVHKWTADGDLEVMSEPDPFYPPKKRKKKRPSASAGQTSKPASESSEAPKKRLQIGVWA